MPPPPDKSPESRRTQLYKGVLELALLSLLDRGPQYGLRILDELRDGAGLDLAEGTLYPLLHRLEKAGFIQAEWRHEASASHPRKYYGLTPAGATDLADQRQVWLDLTGRLNAFLQRT
ncbi:PadR family transcriptional regulator [Asticcacaulis sp. AC402]|uniref:PadR family transcriptional regulator n=1 Tax=Asticcacaulis sp. AC402 TaxID=1282361 RepID=UPI0003C3D0B0|nr:helix-turn-helix transcriptional regulator [Asticcacaulis sp. AC402]ESQ74218.1 PadR family transcripitonal regulator [Asticcacaulis sp. AC402]